MTRVHVGGAFLKPADQPADWYRMGRAPSIRSQHGFTLVEVLVAMSIAAVGFLGLAATHVTSVRATVLGRNVSLATSIANESIETLRRTPYAQIASTSPTTVTREGINFTSATTVAIIAATRSRIRKSFMRDI